ncbi:hypothetical protein [Jatrophihabitans endophyticus]|uniref:hypothetical protein n=1 Tax=Jatrophihabitans endophyticus TaxID=1206085 RepID=UPI001A09E38E|nr:hypothetical protein [Jatrophihabitans endophyticus]MBE7186649.1 hypothetical protein [Jatrophihabitans endophyticus]
MVERVAGGSVVVRPVPAEPADDDVRLGVACVGCAVELDGAPVGAEVFDGVPVGTEPTGPEPVGGADAVGRPVAGGVGSDVGDPEGGVAPVTPPTMPPTAEPRPATIETMPETGFGGSVVPEGAVTEGVAAPA